MPYGFIVVPASSRLIFADENISLHTTGITVHGSVEAGSPQCRLKQWITITLHGSVTLPPPSTNGAAPQNDRYLVALARAQPQLKGIVVSPSAHLSLHGALFHPTWTRLARPALPGDAFLFLQDCVNWEAGQRLAVTTAQHLDSRGFHQNEERTVASPPRCVTVHGHRYGLVPLDAPLQYYHHAGEREWACEVLLLSRRLVVAGSGRSEPTDTTPLSCGAKRGGCPGTFLTGLGGHVLVSGTASVAGVELYRMGQTNVMARYPLHFHRAGARGTASAVSDCAVHRSFFRGYVVHDTSGVTLRRNVAYDVIGHVFYVESGVEEGNRFEFNAAAFVHSIGAPPQGNGQFLPVVHQSPDLLVPVDVAPSGFYITNANNTLVGNAAVGGWTGFSFPSLPQPVDPVHRFTFPGSPSDRPAALISGNSARSSSYFSALTGCVYVGGALYYASAAADAPLVYNPGRIVGGPYVRRPRHSATDGGGDAWLRMHNFTLALCSVGVTDWNIRSEWLGVEAHDIVTRSTNAFGRVWLHDFAVNCRSSVYPHVLPSLHAAYAANKYAMFRGYDTGQSHILTNWTISNCNSHSFASGAGVWNLPYGVNHPQVQIASAGVAYTAPLPDLNAPWFWAKDNAGKISRTGRFLSNWMDTDGSLSLSRRPTIIGSAESRWFRLDTRPGHCVAHSQFKYPMYFCSARHLSLASFALGYDAARNGGTAPWYDTLAGNVTHLGTAASDGSPLSYDPDIAGAHNHSRYGGWYHYLHRGVPLVRTISAIQVVPHSVLLVVLPLPPGLPRANVSVVARHRSRASCTHTYTHVSSPHLVRTAPHADAYHIDSRNRLYLRVAAMDVCASPQTPFDAVAAGFHRGGLHIPARTAKNRIIVTCDCRANPSDPSYCDTLPAYQLPAMGCPPGQQPVGIGTCAPSPQTSPSPSPSRPSPPQPPSHTCADVASTVSACEAERGRFAWTCTDRNLRPKCSDGLVMSAQGLCVPVCNNT